MLHGKYLRSIINTSVHFQDFSPFYFFSISLAWTLVYCITCWDIRYFILFYFIFLPFYYCIFLPFLFIILFFNHYNVTSHTSTWWTFPEIAKFHKPILEASSRVLHLIHFSVKGDTAWVPEKHYSLSKKFTQRFCSHGSNTDSC